MSREFVGMVIESDFKILDIEKKSKAKALSNVEVGDVISVSYNLNGGKGYAPEVQVLNKDKDYKATWASATVFKQCIAGYKLEKLV